MPRKVIDSIRVELQGTLIDVAELLRDAELETESFGISRDGAHLTLAQVDWGASLLQVDGVTGIGRQRDVR